MDKADMVEGMEPVKEFLFRNLQQQDKQRIKHRT